MPQHAQCHASLLEIHPLARSLHRQDETRMVISCFVTSGPPPASGKDKEKFGNNAMQHGIDMHRQAAHAGGHGCPLEAVAWVLRPSQRVLVMWQRTLTTLVPCRCPRTAGCLGDVAACSAGQLRERCLTAAYGMPPVLPSCSWPSCPPFCPCTARRAQAALHVQKQRSREVVDDKFRVTFEGPVVTVRAASRCGGRSVTSVSC